jgi:hypothetical protein
MPNQGLQRTDSILECDPKTHAAAEAQAVVRTGLTRDGCDRLRQDPDSRE